MVNEPHAAYRDMIDRWTRCRDVYGGSDAVKAKRTTYLPALGGTSSAGSASRDDPYTAYLLRAMFYPAMGRTVGGLAGLVFGKPPTVAGVPIAQQPEFQDVTLSGVSLAAYAVTLCQDILTTGRAGTLIDFPDGVTSGARPYWVSYAAESIVNWRTTRINGQQMLTLLVLREDVEEPKADDFFTAETRTQYRVLHLVEVAPLGPRQCEVTVYREDPEHRGTFLVHTTGVPRRRGVALPFIPFTFLGPMGTEPDVDHPPLVDLVDVNLSHYRTSADREWAAHFCALPTAVLTGHTLPPGEVLTIGSSNAWVLPNPDAAAEYLEFSGEGIGALKDLMEDKERLMQVLGAKILEGQKNVQEAAQTVRLRHAGEGSALGLLAEALGQSLTQSLRWHLWWSGLDETTADKALVTMNPEMLDDLTAADIQTLVMSWQASGISKKTLFYNMQAGGWQRPEITFEQEEDDIRREGDNLDLPAPLPAVP